MDDITLDEEIEVGEKGLSGSMKANLKEAFRWMRLVALFSFIAIGAMLLMLLWAYSISSGYQAEELLVGIVAFIIAGGIQTLIMLQLHKAGSAYKSYLQTNATSDLELAFAKQKQFWLIVGILACIGVFFFVIGFLNALSTVTRFGGPF